jgi:biotin synthase-like enzyme
VFLGSRLLTTANPELGEDEKLFADLGIRPMGVATEAVE